VDTELREGRREEEVTQRRREEGAYRKKYCWSQMKEPEEQVVVA